MSAPESDENSPVKLVRELGLFSAFCFVAGSVIGTGVFRVAADAAEQITSPFWALSVWLVAGILSIMGGLLFAELGCAFPKAGGQYVYLRELVHPMLGFLYGWTLVLVIQTGTIAAVAIGFADFAAKLYPMTPVQIKLLATGAILAFTAFNTLGVKKGARLLDLITALKLIALVAISAIGVHLAISGGPLAAAATTPAAPFTLSAYGVALIAVFWAYDGWNNVTFIAGEIRNPRKYLPIAMGLGMATVTALYLLANFAYYQLLEPQEFVGKTFIAAEAAERWGGPTAVRAVTLLVVLSALGCLNAMVIGGARVVYAMADDHVLPRTLAKLNRRTHSPNVALYFQAAWTCLLVWSGRYDQLFTYVVFAAFIFYGLTALTIFRLRRSTTYEDATAYRAPLYPWLPLFYILFVGVFSLNALITQPRESLAGLAIIAAGIPAYFLFKRVNDSGAPDPVAQCA